jgi:hypothetical protein
MFSLVKYFYPSFDCACLNATDANWWLYYHLSLSECISVPRVVWWSNLLLSDSSNIFMSLAIGFGM